jgi:hypothetical protein
MNKALVVLVVVLSVLAQPALAGRGGSNPGRAKAAEGQKSATVTNGPSGTCRKYFAVIGAVVSVPC